MKRLARLLAVVPLIAAAVLSVLTVSAAPASAASCYGFGRSLSQGASGEDVRQLQIRVSGYPGYGAVLAIDGQFGAGTKAAVTRFQQAYGLGADGVAGPATFAKLSSLEDSDCTPVNFSYAELNRCNSTWSGGAVSAATAKVNALVTMWKLQAMRHALGDRPITVNGGFRSYACNSAVGGAAGSRHLYGDAADLGAGGIGFCKLAQQARNHGFSEILGPGYPDHNDHTHLANRSGRLWSAPSCGI